MQSTLPDGAQQCLHKKPLNAAIGQCLRCITPAAAMVIVIGVRKNKTYN
jgi:hypothetical protein